MVKPGALGKIILAAGQIACCLGLNETLVCMRMYMQVTLYSVHISLFINNTVPVISYL